MDWIDQPNWIALVSHKVILNAILSYWSYIIKYYKHQDYLYEIAWVTINMCREIKCIFEMSQFTNISLALLTSLLQLHFSFMMLGNLDLNMSNIHCYHSNDCWAVSYRLVHYISVSGKKHPLIFLLIISKPLII